MSYNTGLSWREEVEHAPWPMAWTSHGAVGIALIVMAALVLLGAAPAHAQQNRPAEIIAENGDPTLVVPNFMQCFTLLSKSMKPKDASRECRKAINEGGKISTKNNNEAADATKNTWPKPIVVPAYGTYGYGTPYYGNMGVTFSGSGGYNKHFVAAPGTCGEGGCNRRY